MRIFRPSLAIKGWVVFADYETPGPEDFKNGKFTFRIKREYCSDVLMDKVNIEISSYKTNRYATYTFAAMIGNIYIYKPSRYSDNNNNYDLWKNPAFEKSSVHIVLV